MAILDLPPRPFFSEHFPVAKRFIEQNKFRANRFIFDDVTVARIGELCRDRPDVIMDNIQFARWPYETTYIEWRSDIFSNIVNKPLFEMGAKPQFPSGTEDREVGILFHKGIAATIVGTNSRETMAKSTQEADSYAPMFRFYNYGAPRLAGTMRVQLEPTTRIALMFGGSSHFVAKLSDETKRHLIGLCEYDYEYGPLERVGKGPATKAFISTMMEGAGEFRALCAMLLWLNQPRWTQITRVGASRRLIRNKVIAYAAHNVVTLTDMSVKRMAAVLRSQSMQYERDSPRRHTVRGFYRHYHKVPGCVHEWPFEPNEKEQWVCGRCGTMRVWVPSHERGDAGKGFVTKEYTTS